MSKSPDAFRTISEVAEDLELPQHVLRFWETRFNQIKPMKRGGGRRYYRPEDVELLRNIKALLYKEGYTIRGVQRLLKEQGAKKLKPVTVEEPEELPASSLMQVDGPVSQTDLPQKTAIDVEEYSRQQNTKKPKSILNRLSTMVGGEDSDMDLGDLSANDMQHLKATLQELLECKRLLDQTRQG